MFCDISTVSTVCSVLPEYIVPFTIHLLSHRLASSDDVEGMVAVNQYVYFAGVNIISCMLI